MVPTQLSVLATPLVPLLDLVQHPLKSLENHKRSVSSGFDTGDWTISPERSGHGHTNCGCCTKLWVVCSRTGLTTSGHQVPDHYPRLCQHPPLVVLLEPQPPRPSERNHKTRTIYVQGTKRVCSAKPLQGTQPPVSDSGENGKMASLTIVCTEPESLSILTGTSVSLPLNFTKPSEMNT